MSNTIRLDKWLWAARFFKTRSLASHAVDLGRVLLNEQKTKPAHAVKLGDLIEIHQAEQIWLVEVLQLLDVRGSAPIAQTMYAETPESQKQRQQQVEKRRYQNEPSALISQRPTKRQRRLLNAIKLDS